MKTIKVFIASSDELHLERLEFTDMVMQLNKAFRPRGIEIEPVKWEWHNNSMTPERKQTEYNNALKECEMCLVLYWNIRGEFTEEELNVAYDELKAGNNPRKLYVYFKEPADDISKELQDFKTSFTTKYGHFYCRFENVDTFRLNFLLQFEQYHSNKLAKRSAFEVKNSKVIVAGHPYANLQKIPFAGNNPDYQRLQEDIRKTQEEITTFESIFATTPNEQIGSLLKNKRLDREKLCKQLEKMELSLLDTAKLIVKLSYSASNSRLQQAIELFVNGNNKGANAVLDFKEISSEMAENGRRIDNAKDIQKKAHEIEVNATEALLSNIEECKLKVRTLITDKPEGWLQECDKIYKEAIIQSRRRVEHDIHYELLSDATLLMLQNMNLDNDDINSLYLYFMEKDAHKFKSFKGTGTLFGWMKSIVNCHLHKKKGNQIILPPYPAPLDSGDDRKDMLEAIVEACKHMSNQKYAKFMYRLMVDLESPQSIAEDLGLSRTAFLNIKARAINQLTREIKALKNND